VGKGVRRGQGRINGGEGGSRKKEKKEGAEGKEGQGWPRMKQ